MLVMSRRKRIGIMGGTFDPVHMVHLTLAENAYHSFGLDEVLMLPNGDPPHKTDKIITPAVHRLAMLQLAVAGIPYFRISDMEIRRKGYSYSSVTLEELKKAHPDTDYYFIMGADSLFQCITAARVEAVKNTELRSKTMGRQLADFQQGLYLIPFIRINEDVWRGERGQAALQNLCYRVHINAEADGGLRAAVFGKQAVVTPAQKGRRS